MLSKNSMPYNQSSHWLKGCLPENFGVIPYFSKKLGAEKSWELEFKKME